MLKSQPLDSFIDTKAELSNLYKVLQDVMDAISVGRTRLPNRDVYLFALNKIYLNLFVVWKHNPKKTVGISRRKSYWDGKSIYKHPKLSYTVMVNRMLNNASQQGATLAFSKWLKTSANKDQRFFMKHRTIASVQKAILAHHPKIAHHFFKGKPHGQRIAWVEANSVFTVAQQLALMGVPVLTVHDEFICKKEDEELVWEVMYSTYVDYKNI